MSDDKRIERLSDFAKTFAMCPCCNKLAQCDEDCTFESDMTRTGQTEFIEWMKNARSALYD